MITVKYPGKLYIMGEYSVMEKNHHAVICAVNRYLSATIEKSDALIIQSDHGFLTSNKNNLPHVEAALKIAQAYLDYKKIEFKAFKMRIKSELDDGKNKKYGFGSSGVVIVAVMDAILKYHNITVEPLILFKLSVLTQVNMNEVSSGGDLACSIFGGMISYRRYESLPISIEDVEKEWKGLEIKVLNKDFDVLVGYTQKSFSSSRYLNKVKAFKLENNDTYKGLVDKAEMIVLEFIKDPTKIELIDDYREWMLQLSENVGIEIETSVLKALIESANDLGYKSKVSGAGGGDCGIALSKDKDQTELIRTWKNLGIEVLEGVL